MSLVQMHDISSSPCRSATNPKAPSAQPSSGSWAVSVHGNIAVAGIRLPLPIGTDKRLSHVASELSAKRGYWQEIAVSLIERTVCE